MKRAFFIFLVVGTMVYGAYFSSNYQSSSNNATASDAAPLPVTNEPISTIPAIILPHLENAAEQRQKLLSEVAVKTMPSRIIMVSVDHFNAGKEDISVYPSDWQVQNGVLKLDTDLYDNIVSSGYAVSDANAFNEEHGIKNILADVYNVFPRSNFTSLIIKDSVNQKTIEKLADFLYSGDPQAMIVASVDFSHYNQKALANIHDSYSIQALSNLDSGKIWSSETDSPQTLLLAADFAKAANSNFHLMSHGNSADANQNDDAETTSFVLGYYNAEPVDQPIEKSTSFIIAGDMMLDRNVWHNFKDIGLTKIFDNLGNRVFKGVDMSLLNNEGPISSKEINDDYASGSMIFNFPPETIDVLKYLGIKSVSLANNHSMNAGSSGFFTTQSLLRDANIAYFGEQNGFDANTAIYRLDGGVPISIIAIDTLSSYNDSSLQKAIKQEQKEGRFVIIFPHWGTEYKTTHDANQQKLAKGWIAAGAGLIIGSHPHVVEDFEIIDNVPVVYSLGNFVFDQFFSDETQHGLIMAGIISDKKITLTFQPTKEVNIKPEILQGSEKTEAISKIFDINSQQGFIKISNDTIEISR